MSESEQQILGRRAALCGYDAFMRFNGDERLYSLYKHRPNRDPQLPVRPDEERLFDGTYKDAMVFLRENRL